MDLTYLRFMSNLDVIYFIYGLAFVVMGIVIMVQPKQDSRFQLAHIMWLLAVFGLTHGINEWLDMWAIIKGRQPRLDVLRWVTLIASFFFLFEFGRRLYCIKGEEYPDQQRKAAKLISWWISPAIGAAIFIISLNTHDFWETGSILSRYFLCFPAGLLIASGFYSYYGSNKKLVDQLRVKIFFSTAGVAFLIYGVFAGLVVSRGDFYPSNWLNADSFLSVLKFPVQIIRSMCAVVIALSVGGILKMFNWEMITELNDNRQRLEKQVREYEETYREVFEHSNDIIYFVDSDNFITLTNSHACEILGYSKKELIGVCIKEIFMPETWNYLEKGMVSLKKQGSFFLDAGKMIKKNGDNLFIDIYSFAMFDNRKNFLGARLLIRDITERVKLESELNTRVRELEQFYDMAVGRELKMEELKKEIERLTSELPKKNYM